MAGDHPATAINRVEGEGSVVTERSDRWAARGRLVARHWKSWATAAALGLAAYGLHGIGGWTLDTTVFTAAALLVVGYRVVTLAKDVRSI